MEQTIAAPATQIPDELEATFERLYRDSRDDVYAYVRGIVRDQGVAEDVTALAFERAWRKRRSFKPRARVAPRLAVRDRPQRRPRRASPPRPPAGADRPSPPDPDAPDPADVTDLGVRRAALRTAMAELSTRERELVALKFFAGLSGAEIATVIGTSESNAGTRLHRVIEKLRSACDENA